MAYKRQYEGEEAFVFFNTARHSIFAQGVDTGLEPGTVLVPRFGEPGPQRIVIANDGTLSMELPPKASWVLVPSEDRAEPPTPFTQSLRLDTALDGATLTTNATVTSSGARPGEQLTVVRNNNLASAQTIMADDQGNVSIPVEVSNLGEEAVTLKVYAMDRGAYSNQLALTTKVETEQIRSTITDPEADDQGPAGPYIRMQQPNSGAQKDIREVSARVSGANLELTLTMAEVTDGWQPPNGFDNLMLSTFIDLPDRDGASVLPQMNAALDGGEEWDVSHIATGWSSAMYDAAEATTHDRGATLGLSPTIDADPEAGQIRIHYRGEPLGISDWSGTKIYLATWDSTQEAGYAELQPEPANWHVGGGASDDPKVMDDARLVVLND